LNKARKNKKLSDNDLSYPGKRRKRIVGEIEAGTIENSMFRELVLLLLDRIPVR
jgi:hypothetical protein